MSVLDVTWERDGGESTAANVSTPDGRSFHLRAAVAPPIQGWLAFVALNGAMIHTSEHAGRREAQDAAEEAMRRGMDLRSVG